MAKPWPYIGPWLLEPGDVDEAAVLRVVDRMKSMQRSTCAPYGPRPGVLPPDMKAMPASADDGDVAAVAAGAERAVVVLLLGEKRESAIDGALGLGRDKFRRGSLGIGGVVGDRRANASQTERRGQTANHKSTPSEEWDRHVAFPFDLQGLRGSRRAAIQGLSDFFLTNVLKYSSICNAYWGRNSSTGDCIICSRRRRGNCPHTSLSTLSISFMSGR